MKPAQHQGRRRWGHPSATPSTRCRREILAKSGPDIHARRPPPRTWTCPRRASRSRVELVEELGADAKRCTARCGSGDAELPIVARRRRPASPRRRVRRCTSSPRWATCICSTRRPASGSRKLTSPLRSREAGRTHSGPAGLRRTGSGPGERAQNRPQRGVRRGRELDRDPGLPDGTRPSASTNGHDPGLADQPRHARPGRETALKAGRAGSPRSAGTGCAAR